MYLSLDGGSTKVYTGPKKGKFVSTGSRLSYYIAIRIKFIPVIVIDIAIVIFCCVLYFSAT